MAKKKRGRPKKRGRKPQRIKVKGYTRRIAVFNGATRAHAKTVRVKAHTRKRSRKKGK